MPLPLYGQLLLGSGHEHRQRRDGQSGRQLDQYLSSRHALPAGQIALCWRCASDGLSLLRFTLSLDARHSAYIVAWQVAVFIALRAESVDT